MTRDDFVNLPRAELLGLIYDKLFGANSGKATGRGQGDGRSPKFDRRIYRKGGYQWASETEHESLVFWLERAQQGCVDTNQYRERNEKDAKALAYWVSFRENEPTEPWQGVRDDEQVTALPPSRHPKLYLSEHDAARKATRASAEAESDIPF